MNELINLSFGSLCDPRMHVPGIHNGNSGKTIQVRLPILTIDLRPGRMPDNHGLNRFDKTRVYIVLVLLDCIHMFIRSLSFL
jgi:hypothetical protein